MTHPSAALVRRFLEEVWNDGQVDVLAEVLDPAFVAHDPLLGDYHGLATMAEHTRAQRRALPDLHVTIDDVLIDGDRVAVRWTLTGTHLGPLLGIPPTQRPVRVTGTDIYRVAHDHLTEGWFSWDVYGMMQQLGVGLMQERGSS